MRKARALRRIPLLLAALVMAGCRGERRAEPESSRTARIVAARSQGLAMLQQDRLDEAEEAFRELVELAPGQAAGYAHLALVAIRRGEFDGAERWARRASDRAPRDPEIRLILARIHQEAGRGQEARQELERALEADPDHLAARYALAELEALTEGARGVEPGARAAARDRRQEDLREILARAPGNLAVRLELAASLLRAGEADSAAAHMEEVRSLAPGLPAGAAPQLEAALERSRAGDAAGALAPFGRFRDLLAITGPYQADLQELRGPRGEAAGFLSLAFSHEITLQVPDEAAVLEALRFADATAFSGLGGLAPGDGEGERPEGGARLAVADVDGDGDGDLFGWSPAGPGGAGRGFLLRNDLGRFVDVTPGELAELGSVRAAVWGDYDGDAWADLYVVRDGPNLLLRGEGGGRLAGVSEAARVDDSGEGRSAVFVDVDPDGDVDLLLANREDLRLYRNHMDGTFTERAREMGLAGGGPAPGDAGGADGGGSASVLAYADFDADVDVDLVVARGEAGIALYRNLRLGRFEEVSRQVGLGGAGPAVVVAVGDYDNDGLTDLLVAGSGGGDPAPGAVELRLFRSSVGGQFRPDHRSDATFAGLASLPVADAAFLDFDNDGHLDLAVAGRPRAGAGQTGDAGEEEGKEEGVRLFRNDGEGTFRDVSEKLPSGLPAATDLEVFDYNDDGDLDLLVGLESGGVRLLRNDGGNVNHHVEIRLTGRGSGSGKVNRFGVGSRLLLRAGDLFASREATGPVVHFGLGHRLKADVIRVVWTNGVPQDLYWPGTDQDLIESQTLKGSCAFVYGWDGKRPVFVKDAMWKSALGMPVGIMSSSAPGTTARVYAPPGASREYVRIPGSLLRPVDGAYRLRLTEELWEVAYVDEVKLLAVDHPDSLELFVDERFVPPGPPSVDLYGVARERPPVAATDGRGNDLLPALLAPDDRYASHFSLDRYQGIAEPHDLILDLGRVAAEAERVFLFLRGWIFPTDASINVALAQSGALRVRAPSLEVPDGTGGWVTAIPELGFPAGKEKTVVAELTGLLPRADPKVRIRTNMQVYWDHAFFATEPTVARRLTGKPADVALALAAATGLELRPATLRLTGAELRFRGFSREFRKGGRYGPQWFDYEAVSTAPRWLPIPGRYTRYGDVLPLLGAADDMYTILAPGDEMILEFRPEGITEPAPGWSRTFLLYTDGWIKDADLNTATGERVTPLPFHAQGRYPYGPPEEFPSDPAHREWAERYNTREIPAGGVNGIREAPRIGSRARRPAKRAREGEAP
ncbi:MAG: FG-GAP-like repeat-containing protein [Gemmatimonadota bacterium]